MICLSSEVLQFYDEDYLFFTDAITPPERTENELEFIWDVLKLREGNRVLDLGCGHGRIANGLARRGADVTGIDLIPLFVERARADAAHSGVTADYRIGDMRNLTAISEFDAVILWHFSFGYHSDSDNQEILRATSRALKPGGRLLVDQYNTSALARAGEAYSVLDLGDDLILQRPICLLEQSRWGAERIIVRAGMVRRASFMCRCYSPSELRAMIANAGFGIPTFLGDGYEPLSLDSTKQIMVTVKAGSAHISNE